MRISVTGEPDPTYCKKLRRTAPGRVITLTQHRFSPTQRLSEEYEEVFFPIIAFLEYTQIIALLFIFVKGILNFIMNLL